MNRMKSCNLSLSLSLSLTVLRSLKDNYDQALRRDDVKAIVVTGECEDMLICIF
jgi:enoyl-CoA hydratase/carnithine racemase